MKKIAVCNWISVDGIFSGPNGDTTWFTPDAELEKENINSLKGSDTILFGRVTFEMMAAFWPTTTAFEQMPEIATYMTESKKHIFSKTVSASDWQHSIFHKSIDAATVAQIKNGAEKDIVILGSGEVSMALHQLGLIDAYTIFLDPQLLGKGKRFFENIDRSALRLENSKTYKSGTVRLQYEVVR